MKRGATPKPIFSQQQMNAALVVVPEGKTPDKDAWANAIATHGGGVSRQRWWKCMVFQKSIHQRRSSTLRQVGSTGEELSSQIFENGEDKVAVASPGGGTAATGSIPSWRAAGN